VKETIGGQKGWRGGGRKCFKRWPDGVPIRSNVRELEGGVPELIDCGGEPQDARRHKRASRIPAQKHASGDQVLKMLPQLGRHIAAHKQDTQLKIAEEGIVRKIGA